MPNIQRRKKFIKDIKAVRQIESLKSEIDCYKQKYNSLISQVAANH